MMTGAALWARLEPKQRNVLERVRRYASMTIPSVALLEGFDQTVEDKQHDFQSIGAQAVNHIVNKLMLAGFAPSRPNFRIDAPEEMVQKLIDLGVVKSPADVSKLFADGEKKATRYLDRTGQRTKLYQVYRHLVVAGNVLLDKSNKEQLRVMALSYYAVERDVMGRVLNLVIREKVPFMQLEEAVQAEVNALRSGYDAKRECVLYKCIMREVGGNYRLTQYVDDVALGEKFNGNYPTYMDMPYHPMVWDLADDADYGDGLVGLYAGDFEALSIMSEATVKNGVLASEFRWLVNPSGGTSAADFQNSNSGDAIPGREGDIQAVSPESTVAVKTLMELTDVYTRRIATGFLLGSAIVRDSERTTAEEVRMQAVELDTAHGGVYSSLGAQLQKPVALWCLKGAGFDLAGTKVDVSIITGLDALSRNGDLEQLRVAFGYLSDVQNASPQLVERIKWDEYVKFVEQGTGAPVSQFVMSSEEYEQLLANRQAQALAAAQQQATDQAAANAGGQIAVNQQTQGQ